MEANDETNYYYINEGRLLAMRTGNDLADKKYPMNICPWICEYTDIINNSCLMITKLSVINKSTHLSYHSKIDNSHTDTMLKILAACDNTWHIENFKQLFSSDGQNQYLNHFLPFNIIIIIIIIRITESICISCTKGYVSLTFAQLVKSQFL